MQKNFTFFHIGGEGKENNELWLFSLHTSEFDNNLHKQYIEKMQVPFYDWNIAVDKNKDGFMHRLYTQ